MQSEKTQTNNRRNRRAQSVRRTLKNRARVSHRLVVVRSLNHTSAYIVNDLEHKVEIGVSTQQKDLRTKGRTEAAQEVGKLLAKQATGKGIDKVVFDRGAYKFHGRVKALAEGAREGGLKF